VSTIFEGTGNGQIELPVQEGSSRIKIVGKKASGSINFEIFGNDNLRIIPKN